MVHILNQQQSVFNQYIAEIRDVSVQTDRMRFRRNLERMGEVFAYEISKTLPWAEKETLTPLGKARSKMLSQQPVLATILRAGSPLHQGMLNYFDKADNAFIAAYRKHHPDGSFDISLNYMACPSLTNRVLIIADPMLATGASLVKTIGLLQKEGAIAELHIACVIASREGVNHLLSSVPGVKIWCGDIDEDLNSKGYIVPGLGDAGDLAFGEKAQS